jgi:hypothetical protein
MKTLLQSFSTMTIAGCLALTGCNGSNTPAMIAQIPNVSGDYSGTFHDGIAGTGAATTTLAQHGSNAGGAINAATPGGGATAQISLTIASSNALTGAMVINYPSGTTCTFSTTGTYSNNGSTAGISGSFVPVTGCSGDSGTYTLTQECTDTITSAIRPFSFPAQC